MNFATLDEWLGWVKSQHVREMDLSLERVQEVALRLNLLNLNCPIVTVAGTNGKGSTVAALEAVYLAGGYRVGTFTSPYLYSYNEQIRLQAVSVADGVLCDAFQQITQVADGIRLTQFELGTLAALHIFWRANLDVCLLEVGLGGRFDAVNVVDADIAIVTSIGIDHVEWLGNTREAIAHEKAGIFRPYIPVVCGDFQPPETLFACASVLKAPFFAQGKEFGFVEKDNNWSWWGPKGCVENLPLSALALQNMSTALMAVDLLQEKLPIRKEVLDKALVKVTLPGRIQVVPGEIEHIFDVSHNPASVEWLANYLQKHPSYGQTHAVFSMLADKDILTSIQLIQNCINYWYTASLEIERAASIEKLITCFREAKVNQVNFYESILMAYETAFSKAHVGDRIVIFGSFHTVADVGRIILNAEKTYV